MICFYNNKKMTSCSECPSDERCHPKIDDDDLIDYGEDFVFAEKEAMYDMPYHELDDIRCFVRNHEWDDIPDSIKEHLEKWEKFLSDYL